MDERINKVGEDYICPYCFRKIPIKSVQFRSNNPIAIGRIDYEFMEYWGTRTGDNNKYFIPLREPVTPRIRDYGLYKIRNSAGKSVPVAYCDEGGSFSQERICPNCHNTLPPTAGFVNTLNIVIIGPSNNLSYEYTKKLFSSMKSSGLSIPNVSFFVPNINISSLLTNKEESKNLNCNDYPYLSANVIVPDKNNKTYCECTISYMPFSKEYMKYSNENIKVKNFITDVLTMADAIILAADYSDIVEISEGSINSVNAFDDYLTYLKNYVGLIASSELSIPIAITLSNNGLADQIKNLENNNRIDKSPFSLDYESEAKSNKTTLFIESFCNRLIQDVEYVFKDNKFFTVPGDNKSKSEIAFQNPLHWLLESFGCLDLKNDK